MYTHENFRTKKALREALARGETVSVFEPGPFPAKQHGEVTIEGPHYPEPHRWYARVEIQDGAIVKVIS